ncbi:hypothetical protein [Butyrivibrio sp. XPD2002]|uniref:hypothetical protein n=1 Tax=Butyrivibrio sp. XPD2002 TaxID=1280665 RepID=UPI00047DAF3A|nr:hypothetical protein [Butyrivibrio sp. XPD2002]
MLIYQFRSVLVDEKEGAIGLKDIRKDAEFELYIEDLLRYGLEKYDIDFYEEDSDEVFHLWMQYRKEQVQLLLLNNPTLQGQCLSNHL